MISESLKDLMERSESDKIVLHFDRFEVDQDESRATLRGIIDIPDDVCKMISNSRGTFGDYSARIVGGRLEFVWVFDRKMSSGTIQIDQDLHK